MVLDGNPSRSSGKPVGAFYITASNDGNQFSDDEGLVIIFDSKCLHMKLSFTDQSFKLQEREREREREDKMNISFAID